MASETKIAPFEKCCRTCLKEDTLMFDIFIERLESTNLADMLVSCTKLKIQEDDSLPKQICRYCYNCLISFSHFCNMAQKAQGKLQEAMLNSDVFHQNNSEGDIFEIKIENRDHDYLFESHEENDRHEDLDENINLETHNSNNNGVHNVSHNGNKAENFFYCSYCNKHFSKLCKLKHHEKKHFNSKESRSKQCHETKQNDNTVSSMINVGNPDLNESSTTDFTCIICSSRFESMNLLTAHLKSHEAKERMISGHHNKVFNNVSHLKQHKIVHNHNCPHTDLLNTITPKENVNTNICETNLDSFECDKCLLTFKNINSLSAHMRKHTEKGRVISCKECNKVFKKLSHLKRHEIQHEINCPYKCTVCPKAFPTEDALRDHVNKHRGVKPHGCPVCGKKFSHLSTLTAHIKIHTRDKSFLCPTCGKKFDSSTNLNQHISRHIGLKEFACTLCPKRFVSKGELKSHTITHTGERSYTCDQCGATFTKRSSLTKHKIRHLGLKPHQCDTCLMRFTCKDHLKRHYRIHTGEKPYKCDMCERAFTQSNDLVKHRRSHLGDKVYKCPQCAESFRLNVELRQHISEHFVSSQNVHAADVPHQPPTDGVSKEFILTNVIGQSN